MIFDRYQRSPVICDWLDVTCNPEDSFLFAVRQFLASQCCPVTFADDQKMCYQCGDPNASLHINKKPYFHRVSLSGRALDFFRQNGSFLDLLSVLGSVPHRITRLDAACDIGVDGAIALELFRRWVPSGSVALTRKALKLHWYTQQRSDGKQTGTMYVGKNTNAKVCGKLYDKAHEIGTRPGTLCEFQQAYFSPADPHTRIELTFRKEMNATLRDAYMPASLFYQYSSKLGLSRPDNVDEWSAHGEPWQASPVSPKLPIELYKRRIELSPELAELFRLAAQFGPEGKAVLMRYFESGLDSALRGAEQCSEAESEATR